MSLFAEQGFRATHRQHAVNFRALRRTDDRASVSGDHDTGGQTAHVCGSSRTELDKRARGELGISEVRRQDLDRELVLSDLIILLDRGHKTVVI